MRLYHIASGILLILPIIKFAVAAPVLLQQQPQVNHVLQSVEDHAKTTLEKRVDGLGGLWFELFGDAGGSSPQRLVESPPRPEESSPRPEESSPRLEGSPSAGPSSSLLLELFGHSPSPTTPEESSAASPLLSPQPSGPPDVPMDVEKLVLSTPNELSQSASAGYGPPSPSSQELNDQWLDQYYHHLSYEPLSPPASWGSSPPGPTDDWDEVEQPVSSIQNQVVGPGHGPPSPSSDALNNLWLEFYGHHPSYEPFGAAPSWGSSEPVPTHVPPGNDALSDLRSNVPDHHFSDQPLAAPPSWGLPPSGPTHDWNDAGQPAPSISDELSQVAGPSHVSSGSGDDELDKVWFDLYGHSFFDEPTPARPPWASQPSENSHGPPGLTSSAMPSTGDHGD